MMNEEEPAMGKGLCEFSEDADMEDYDDENNGMIEDFFQKRFSIKKRRLNDDFVTMDNGGNTSSIEESMANLSIDEIFHKATSTDLHEKLVGIIQIRKMVSASDNPPIDDLLKHEILSVFIECLSLPNSKIQFETAWILTNIAAGTAEQTKALHDAFVHLALIKLLGTDCHLDVANQALWALCNFMADNIGFCYQCISADIIKPLTNQMKRFGDNVTLLRFVSRILGQISHIKDSPMFRETAWDLFPILWELSKQSDAEVYTNAIWGLSYLTDNGIEMLMNLDKNVVKDVAPHLKSSSLELQAASLHFLANCVAGDDEITQEIVDCGVLQHLNKFLKHSNPKFVEETSWMVSNILAGTEKQVDAVFEAGLMPTIIGLLENREKKIKEQAIWSITNVPNSGSIKSINALLDLDVIPSLCGFLTNSNKYVILAVVEAINRMQEKCQNRREEIRQKILANGGLEKLRNLQSHQYDDIQKKANQIILDLFNE